MEKSHLKREIIKMMKCIIERKNRGDLTNRKNIEERNKLKNQKDKKEIEDRTEKIEVGNKIKVDKKIEVVKIKMITHGIKYSLRINLYIQSLLQKRIQVKHMFIMRINLIVIRVILRTIIVEQIKIVNIKSHGKRMLRETKRNKNKMKRKHF